MATDNVAMLVYAGDVLWWLCFIREEDIGISGTASHSDSGCICFRGKTLYGPWLADC